MRTVARAIVTVFSVLTAVYAFLASSAFTYQQFLLPRVLPWVGWFSDWHAALFWPCLLLAVASIDPAYKKTHAGRLTVNAFVIVWLAIGLRLTFFPLLPTLVDTERSLFVGLAALLAPIWLALIDHVRLRDYLRDQSRVPNDEEAATTEGRLLAAAIGTAVFVAVLYGVLTPLFIAKSFEPDLLSAGLTIGLGWNLLDHLLIFCGLFLVMALAERAVRPIRSFALRYGVACLVVAAVLTIELQRIVANAIGLDGYRGALAMATLSAAIVFTWAALRLRRLSSCELTSGFDVLFGVTPRALPLTGTIVALLGMAGVAFLLPQVLRLDWDFLLLKLSVLAIWVVSFSRFYAAASRPVRLPGVLVLCAIPLAGHYSEAPVQAEMPRWLASPGYSLRHTLDRYLVYNPTFRLADDLFREQADQTQAFARFMRANTAIDEASVTPASIDFVRNLTESAVTPKPLIFLFVVDSLRPDYLSPYNPRVTFTPRIAGFAAESLVFRNAFTRYGGTGLSMSGLWMGAGGPHRQYVQPFRPMNALEKLLDANRYLRFVSMDHISAELLTPSSSLVELDHGIQELEFDLCGTLPELERRLTAKELDGAPIFAHTRSLNLHAAAVKIAGTADASAYDGFEPRAAARVHRLDGCLGGFVDFLKTRHLYERSIIILMSDHGEMLGEDNQWGHAYYLFPKVLQIPLIVHVPPMLARNFAVDLDTIAFSTDVTPTLYALLGYRPRRDSPLMGRPLLTPPLDADFSARRRAVEVVAASYGAVWGVVRQNGERLYIADANRRREYAYERPGHGAWHEIEVTDQIRSVNQQAIREYIYEVNRVYHVKF
jgi:hypothetical protein